MTINETVRGDVRVLAPGGRLTVETEAVFTTAVRNAFAAGQVQLVLDLAGVPYVDSCGLGVLIQAYVAACRRGGSVKLANISGRNRRLLTITRLLTVFEVFDSAEDAARSFGAAADPAGDQRPEEARNLSTTATNSSGFSSLG